MRILHEVQLPMFVKVLHLSYTGSVIRSGLWAICLIGGLLHPAAVAQPSEERAMLEQADAKALAWVDAMYRSLSEDQIIGQLLMVAAYSNRDESHEAALMHMVRDYHIGGVIFFQGSPYRQAVLTNTLQSASKVPLLIGMDAEWGLAMRLDSVVPFPRQLTVAAGGNVKLISEMGAAIGRECRRLGVHINFAPVVDVNSNPENPVIGSRSFGEQAHLVARYGAAYMKGMMSEGVLANAKHFPGHGDTDTDSHYALPTISKSWEQLNSNEWVPFRLLQKQGLPSVMIAHLHLPALDTSPSLPATLSYPIVTELLQKEMGFEGLVFTDAMNMKGITSRFKKGERELMALHAGVDVLLFPEDVTAAFYRIKFALADSTLSWKRVEHSVRKILYAKYKAGLDAYLPISLNKLTQDLNPPEKTALIYKLYRNAATVVKDSTGMFPLGVIEHRKVAVVSVNDSLGGLFGTLSAQHMPLDKFAFYTKSADSAFMVKLGDSLACYTDVVVALHEVNNRPKQGYGLPAPLLALLIRLDSVTRLGVVVLGVSYAVKPLQQLKHVLVMHQDNAFTRRIAVASVFGATESNGTMPVSSGTVISGAGIRRPSLGRLSHGVPEYLGIESSALLPIDTIMAHALRLKATPGARVLIAKDGMVIWDKTYGYLSYDSVQPVTNETIYDLASVTKVASTAQMVMWLNDRGLIDLRKRLVQYLPSLKGTDKADIRLEDVLAHQAGLQPFVLFYLRTLYEGKPDSVWYRTTPDTNFSLPVAHSLYARNDMEDSIFQWVVDTPLEPKAKGEKKYGYKYSDMGFYLIKKIIEQIIAQPMDEFLNTHFYAPLGAHTLGYKPLARFDSLDIAPTERDERFRQQVLRGTVHDPGAAMAGNVAAHAGLFGNAHDLAKLMQMNLQGGYYGGQYFFMRSDVLRRHTSVAHKGNRRGIVWDKPDTSLPSGPTSVWVSPATYGHTGFTGTAAWVDPQHNLVYIFLSNRVHPKVNNTMLQQNIRTRIQDVVYEAIGATGPQDTPLPPKE